MQNKATKKNLKQMTKNSIIQKQSISATILLRHVTAAWLFTWLIHDHLNLEKIGDPFLRVNTFIDPAVEACKRGLF